MNREQLRAVQAPLKERYRDHPDAALITLSAAWELGAEVSCSSEEELATLQRLTERYCVVFQTLVAAPELTASLTVA